MIKDVLVRPQRAHIWPPEGTIVTSIVVEQVQRALSADHLRTGHWFHHLLVAHLRTHEAKHPPDQLGVAANPAAVSDRIIRRAARKAALLGTGAAGITTAAGMWTAETQGFAGVLALPAAAAAMLGDMAMRAWITIEMSCDVAAMFGVRFDPDDPADLARLYAVALETVSQPENTQDSDKRGHELLERLVPMHSEEASAAVGSMLGSETLLRNVVPVVSLLTSGVTSYRVTRHLGEASMRYARGCRALGDAFAAVESIAPDAAELLIEGVWFVFTSDGRLDAHEAGLLAHFVHRRPSGVREALVGRLRDDESQWLQRLETLPQPARAPFMRALQTAAALDTELPVGERELLAAAAQHLGEAIHPDQVEALIDNFRASGTAGGERVAAGNT